MWNIEIYFSPVQRVIAAVILCREDDRRRGIPIDKILSIECNIKE
jgi:hypothetical protein